MLHPRLCLEEIAPWGNCNGKSPNYKCLKCLKCAKVPKIKDVNHYIKRR